MTLALAVVGAWSTWAFLTGPPGVGHWRSGSGRAAYVAAYDAAFAALPPPTRSHDLSTSHGTVRVYEWADAGDERAPILLVPGRASGVPMWSGNLPRLARERRVLAFDALGDAGMSVHGAPFATWDDQAGYVDEVVARLAPRGVHVVGHSFGGAVAASYARAHPERVRSLTLLEPVFTLGDPPADLFAWAMVASLPVLPEALREHALGRVGGAEYDPADPMSAMIAAGTGHYRAALPQPRVLTDAQRAELSVPTYVAVAERDSLAGGPGAVAAARTLPRAVVHVWPGTTHSLPMQAGAPLDATILRFAADHDLVDARDRSRIRPGRPGAGHAWPVARRRSRES